MAFRVVPPLLDIKFINYHHGCVRTSVNALASWQDMSILDEIVYIQSDPRRKLL
jgi:hypothetical protein